jgi:hypothetical protein
MCSIRHTLTRTTSKGYQKKTSPLFKNFMDVIDEVCPQLQSVCIYTGGKVRRSSLDSILHCSSVDILFCSTMVPT